MPLLKPGDTFPQFTVDTLDGTTLTLPGAFDGHFATVLFYRGSWCPYCNAQLRAFQRASESFAEVGIRRRTWSAWSGTCASTPKRNSCGAAAVEVRTGVATCRAQRPSRRRNLACRSRTSCVRRPHRWPSVSPARAPVRQGVPLSC